MHIHSALAERLTLPHGLQRTSTKVKAELQQSPESLSWPNGGNYFITKQESVFFQKEGSEFMEKVLESNTNTSLSLLTFQLWPSALAQCNQSLIQQFLG